MRSVIMCSSALLLGIVVTGCGGGSKSSTTTNPNQVTSVTVSPNSVSLNAGDVLQITATAANSAGSPVTATFTFSSSNVALVTVSPTGLVCGGVWDSAFVVCNGSSAGSPLTGSATITATGQGVVSSPVSVSIHPKITSVVVDPVAGCTSTTQAQPFHAHACSSLVLPHDSIGSCAPNAKDITTAVGPFTWSTANTTVATVDSVGVVTAHNPGATGIIASSTGVSSPGQPFRTCMPIEIRLHIPGDTPGNLTTSSTLTQNQTLVVEADYTDENGFVQNSAPVTIVSNNPPVATISGNTVTGVSFGGAGLVAACIPPTCGSGFSVPFPIYSNLFQITVPGVSPATTVYATSTSAPPSGTSPSIIPIDTSKSPPAVGTAISLPAAAVPNSFMIDATGDKAYLGTAAGLISLDTTANTVTLVDPNIVGKVLAVSSKGDFVIVSNATIEPTPGKQRLFVFSATTSTFQTFIVPGAIAASFDSDSFKAFIATDSDGAGNVYVFSPQSSLFTSNIGGSSTSVTGLASDPFVYIANSAGIEVMAPCNNSQLPTANNPPTQTNSISLLGSFANSDMIAAVDSSGVDIITATVTSLLSNHTPPFFLNPGNCPPNVSYTNQFVDFSLGPITANQLLVSSAAADNGATTAHVVVLPAGINKVLVARPVPPPNSGAINLAGAGAIEAMSGGMTPDGNKVWVGVRGTNTVDLIDLTNSTDEAQVNPGLKQANGNSAPPDLVVVRPK